MRRTNPERRAAVPRAAAPGRPDPRHPVLPAADVLAAGRQLVAAHRLAGDRPRHLLRLRPQAQRAGRKHDGGSRRREEPSRLIEARDGQRARATVWSRAQGPGFAVALLVLVVARRHARLHADRRVERVGRVLHDGHHGHHRRLPRSPRAVARRPGRSPSCCSSAASARRSTRSRCSRRSSSRAACPSGFSSAGARICSRRINDHFIICGYGRIGRIVAAAVPAAGRAVRRHRPRPRRGSQAAIDGWRAGRRGGRQPRGRAEARRHRPRARPDRGRRHRRRERLHRAERARAAAGPVHRRPRRDRGRRRSS